LGVVDEGNLSSQAGAAVLADGITVVIPTLNRGEALSRSVGELLAQDYSPLEILIVDQSDQADERMLVLSDQRPDVISYHHVNFRGLPPARNFGWKRARFRAILFLDDDIGCYAGLVKEHVRCLNLPGVGVVAGAVEDVRDRGNAPSGYRTGYFHPFTAIPTRIFRATGEFEVDHAQGCNFSASRQVLDACRGFDETLTVGAALYEETDFCLRARRAGYRVLFSGAARIVHLALPRGGCRVPDWREYVWGLAHNRAIMIHRHVRWYRRPVAIGRLLITGMSFSLRKRSYRLLTLCAAGAVKGYLACRRLP
jgi:GT2 family glycosyltransferase